MKSLFVYYGSQRVGTVTRGEELTYAFEYDEAWRVDPQAFALSLSMPLTEKTFGNKITLSFFENLLPEGDVRLQLEESQNIKGTFDFLAKFGKDVAGAFVISEDPGGPPALDPKARIEIDMAKIYEAIREQEPVAEVIAEQNPGYLSLAGAQDKFAAIFDQGKFYLPSRGGATTHIVKSPIQRKGVKESVFNEYYCMQLAHAVGLNVPKTQVIEGEQPLFVIERYDRKTDGGGVVRRLHQQDFCQAQGLTSEFKYEARGGPTLKQNHAFLLEHITIQRRAEDVRQFFKWLCFNLIIGNNDCHSKNISLLMTENRKFALAPFYDLMSTTIYADLQRHFAYRIGGRNDADQMGLQQFEALELDLGVKQGTVRDHLSAMAEAVTQKKEVVSGQVMSHFPATKMPERISEMIHRRIKGLKGQKVFG